MIWNPEYECMDRAALHQLQLRRLQMTTAWAYERVPHYRAAIFFHDADEQRLALASKQALQDKAGAGRPVVTEILPASTFYAAEDYHQDYYEKNPLRYQFYRTGCRRDARLDEVRRIIDAGSN